MSTEPHVHGPDCQHDHHHPHVHGPHCDHAAPAPARNPLKAVGRNDPCPCGSQKKYKKCHGA